MNETMSQIVCSLLEARTVAHKHHLATTSYAQHMALGEFYEGIGEIADTLAEESQGYLGELLDLGLESPATTRHILSSGYAAEDDPQEFLEVLESQLRSLRDGIPESATHILNTMDSAFSLISRTEYKLRFLS